jgi:NAD(P)-dependent dehydrogenase (short-subunit alcohol dehydrogenase family)
MSLDNRVALVTGAAGGIGRNISLGLAARGAKVVVSDLGAAIDGSGSSQAAADEVVAEIRKNGGTAVANYDSVADAAGVKSIIKTMVDNFGRIDILVNNAGINLHRGPLLTAEEWEWDRTMNVNLKGPFMLSQLAVRLMRETGGGNIVNIASAVGIKTPALAIYGVSKAALMMLTQAMAKEWGQLNIRVNAVAPGVIKARLSEDIWKDPNIAAMVTKQCALGCFGEPEDVTETVLFLVSDSARHITGTTIVVDCGEILGTPAWSAQLGSQ